MWDESPPSLQGQLLIAAKHLRDPNFYQSVVLVVEHAEDGAMGLVINRPSTIPVARALEDHFQVPDEGRLVYYGGPVEPAALFVLHNAEALDNGSPVVPGVYVGSSAEAFERVIREATADPAAIQFRVFSGCAGWGPGQLEGEIGRGDWLTLPATGEHAFAENPYSLYETLLHTACKASRIVPETAPHPEWN